MTGRPALPTSGSAKAIKRTRQDLTNSLKDELRLVSSAGAPPPADPGPRQALGACVCVCVFVFFFGLHLS